MRASTIEQIKEGWPLQIEEGWLLRIERIWLLQAASLWRRNGVVISRRRPKIGWSFASNQPRQRTKYSLSSSSLSAQWQGNVRSVENFTEASPKLVLRSRELKVGNERPPRNSMFRNDLNLAFGARNPIVTAWGRILSGLDVRGSVPRDQTRCWLPAVPKTRCRRVSRGKNSLCRRLHHPGLRP
jgi:hypothetical protein